MNKPKKHTVSPNCSPCSVLTTVKPIHNIQDWPDLKKSDVLLVSGSFITNSGTFAPFSQSELRLINSEVLNHTLDYEATAAIKCPKVTETDITAADINLCRSNISETIKVVDPKVIITFGNLALRTVSKLSGVTNKRGKAFPISIDNVEYIVVPTLHPKSVLVEPRLENLFRVDIRNAIQKYVTKPGASYLANYKYASTLKELKDIKDLLSKTRSPIAIDIETTGLNFLDDTIHTVSISYKNGTVVIPYAHPKAGLNTEIKQEVVQTLKAICSNENNIKAFHNAKFDLKFLAQLGIIVRNVWDTAVMASLIDENRPKGLLDLVKEYFPDQIRNL